MALFSNKHVTAGRPHCAQLKLALVMGWVGFTGLLGWSAEVPAAVIARGHDPVFSTAGFYAVADSPRTVTNFNPGWRFHKGDALGAEAAAFDDRQWEAANLPHGLEILAANASGGRNYQGIAWYRKQFTIGKPRDDGKVFLYFEAVMGEARVWVNGQKIAGHFGGYLPFAADITAALKVDGSPNVVAVMANNADSKLYPPGQPQAQLDFAYLGGIYRDTYLIKTGAVHVTLPELSKTVAGGGVFAATLDVNGRDAKMEVRTEVTNSGDRLLNVTVRNTLEDAQGKTVISVSQNAQLKPGEAQQLAQPFEAKNVHLWHPDDPYLHFIRTDVLVGEQVVDSLRTRVGIRRFEMRGADGFFVNKQWIGKKLIGANRHQDYAYVGNALPNSGQWRDVKLLREGGCTIIRVAHYPMDPAFYDACDEFGMLTTTANPGWHFFNFKQKIFEERLYDDTRQLVRRDRNVASILLWETCINEFPRQPAYVMATMHKIAHEEYPFPGLFTVADHDEAKKGGFDLYYHGTDANVNSFNREYGDGNEVDDWFSQNARTRVKMAWGEHALLSQALLQTSTLSDRYATPKVQLGGALWAGIDHQRGYHPDPFRGGLLNEFRLPRYTWYLYQSQYDPDYATPGIGKKPMVYITNELTQVSEADVVVFSNCEEIRLIWQGNVIGTQKPADNKAWAHLPHPPFVFKNVFNFIALKSVGRAKLDAEMVAEGLIGGQVVAREVKRYPQRSSKLIVSVDDAGLALQADGSDFVPVRATVVDQTGAKKVLAAEHVYFRVDGPAEIIGDSATFANPMLTEFGTATALIRATTEPGTITIKAYANGLEAGSVSFASKPAPLPLDYDEMYAAASKRTTNTTSSTMIIQSTENDLPTEVSELQKQLKKARLDLVGKEQDLMELRSQLGETRK